MLVAKKRTEGVEYKKVLVQVDGGLVVAAESTQVRQEGLGLDITDCLTQQKSLQVKIAESGLDQQQQGAVQQ